MSAPLPAGTPSLEIHCLTPQSHKSFLHSQTENLLTLLHSGHQPRLYSASETRALALAHASPPPVPSAALHILLIQKALTTKWLAHTLLYCPETTSTQDVLSSKCFASWTHGCVVVSGCQTRGRGRRGAAWETGIGGVAISIGLKIERGDKLVFLQYVVGLAIVEAVERDGTWNGLAVKVKWPNDVYVGDRKLAGVLCEAVFRDGGFEVVVGVGVNVSGRGVEGVSLKEGVEMRGGKVEGGDLREVFVAGFFNAFERLYDEFLETGFEGRLKDKYLEKWLHGGQRVRIEGGVGGEGVVVGLGDSGWVRIEKEGGEIVEVCPQAGSLDVGNGVVREKSWGERGTNQGGQKKKGGWVRLE